MQTFECFIYPIDDLSDSTLGIRRTVYARTPAGALRKALAVSPETKIFYAEVWNPATQVLTVMDRYGIIDIVQHTRKRVAS